MKATLIICEDLESDFRHLRHLGQTSIIDAAYVSVMNIRPSKIDRTPFHALARSLWGVRMLLRFIGTRGRQFRVLERERVDKCAIKGEV